jgi:peptidoglycan/xylan/chitin deacetylase (PgdA/CDA1 family)
MRVTSHCANHPSKEAGSRCSTCRKWLCDNCLKRYGTRVFCGRWCLLVGFLKTIPGAATATAWRPIHAAWAIAVTAGASAILLWAVGLKVAELVEVHRALGEATRTAGAEISGELMVDGDSMTLVVNGDPGIGVLVVTDEQPLQILELDSNGRATMDDLELEFGVRTIRLVPLSGAPYDLKVPPRPKTKETSQRSAPTAASAAPTNRPTRATTARPSSMGAAAGPTPATAPPVLQLVHDAGPRIAITFDGNASSNRTSELLDLLQRHRLKVTLFVTGEFIERYPAIVRRAVLSGHEIGNHTYSHPHLTTYAENSRHRLLPGVTRRSFQNSLRQTEQAFRAATGRAMQPLWRAPFGEENRLLRGWALELGYLHVRWSSLQGESLDARDWIADEHSSLYQSSSTIMERLLGFPELEGGIVLMHLATERSEAPWAKLPDFLDALEDRGLEPTQVTRLLESSATWRPWLERARKRHRQVHGE